MTWSEAIRRLVQSRALGCCEYCLLDQADAGLPHEVDHVISRKHGGTGGPENLAFACYLCNRYKGSDIASIHPGTCELVRLFHPRQRSLVRASSYHGTDSGVTSQLLRFNVSARVVERQLLQSIQRYPRE